MSSERIGGDFNQQPIKWLLKSSFQVWVSSVTECYDLALINPFYSEQRCGGLRSAVVDDVFN